MADWLIIPIDLKHLKLRIVVGFPDVEFTETTALNWLPIVEQMSSNPLTEHVIDSSAYTLLEFLWISMNSVIG